MSSIKTSVSQLTSAPKPDYPYLGIHKELGTIVLFTYRDTGTVVRRGNTDRCSELGRHSQYWGEDANFEYFKGVLTLAQE